MYSSKGFQSSKGFLHEAFLRCSGILLQVTVFRNNDIAYRPESERIRKNICTTGLCPHSYICDNHCAVSGPSVT